MYTYGPELPASELQAKHKRSKQYETYQCKKILLLLSIHFSLKILRNQLLGTPRIRIQNNTQLNVQEMQAVTE